MVMPQHDIRTAAQNRDPGMAKIINALTWRAGAAGVAAAGLLTFAPGRHAAASGGPPARSGHHPDAGSAATPGSGHRPGNVWRVMTAGAW
jgi:hypothetical protein